MCLINERWNCHKNSRLIANATARYDCLSARRQILISCRGPCKSIIIIIVCHNECGRSLSKSINRLLTKTTGYVSVFNVVMCWSVNSIVGRCVSVAYPTAAIIVVSCDPVDSDACIVIHTAQPTARQGSRRRILTATFRLTRVVVNNKRRTT